MFFEYLEELQIDEIAKGVQIRNVSVKQKSIVIHLVKNDTKNKNTFLYFNFPMNDEIKKNLIIVLLTMDYRIFFFFSVGITTLRDPDIMRRVRRGGATGIILWSTVL